MLQCSVLQYDAAQYVAVCCSTVCWLPLLEELSDGRCNGNQHTVLHYTATSCATTYCTATHCAAKHSTNPSTGETLQHNNTSTSVPAAHQFLHLLALHMYTHIYTYIYAYMCTYIHMYICTYVHICIPHRLTHVSQHIRTSSCTCDEYANP